MVVAAVVPAYRVRAHVIGVVEAAINIVDRVYVVDDNCPEASGAHVQAHGFPESVRVLRNTVNKGVGGAVIAGYRQALADGCDIIVKIDGDGQMDPSLVPGLIRRIVDGKSDYAKGNRFFNIEDLEQMPYVRLFGNAVLSFVSKVSSGYWDIMDPTNGFTAIHRTTLERLPLDKISERYFFESDMLFRLYLENAVVSDFPMRARYGDEISNLNIKRVMLDFPKLYFKNLLKRFFYIYMMRDFNAGSVQTLVGGVMLLFGLIYGVYNWIHFAARDQATPLGTIMITALPIILVDNA